MTFKPRLEQMFPNCAKYKKCCTDDKEFWAKVEIQQNDGHLTEKKTMKGVTETKHEMILHNVNGFKINRKHDNIPEMPEGFEVINLISKELIPESCVWKQK